MKSSFTRLRQRTAGIQSRDTIRRIMIRIMARIAIPFVTVFHVGRPAGSV
jgi:hypothetical protein